MCKRCRIHVQLLLACVSVFRLPEVTSVGLLGPSGGQSPVLQPLYLRPPLEGDRETLPKQ